MRAPGVVAAHNRAGKIPPAPEIQLISNSIKYNGWLDPTQNVTVDVSSLGAVAQTGDFMMLTNFYGAANNGPPATDTVPTGFTRAHWSLIRLARGIYWRTWPAGGLTSISIPAYARMNYKGVVWLLRNVDTSNPFAGLTTFENFNNTNPHAQHTLPNGRSSMLIVARPLGNNAATNNDIAPKPGNLNDARTIYVSPPGSEQYLNFSMYYRILTAAEGNGTVLSPGVIGGTSIWAGVLGMLLRGAAA